ncbi:NAD(P)H-binding protein [Tetragenococcus koreensis]|uniref:NAD(P)H-binding protein n=1 Tax=Tetragenococcus koreensis TaxID=290335 RepID=UPI001F1B28F8|nr:NAD(P)H-binding protein [Tetragenococcus koreensis]MCF1617337.1 NAD(P)H-binding protein [Tetragenococcus koreensis]MDN6630073.1 NAD(P)H-binding protein [Staphylococcus equorum]
MSRTPENVNFPSEVEAIKGDLTQPESFAPALKNVDALYLIGSTDKMDEELMTSSNIITLAEKAGVKKVVLNSVYGDDHLKETIENSSLQWSYIQAASFISNALELNGWKEAINNHETIKTLNLHQKFAIVHEEDIAKVIVTILLEDGHNKKTYQINGGEAISAAEQLDILSRVLNTEIFYEEQTLETAIKEWKFEGATEEDIYFFVEMSNNPPEMGTHPLPTIKNLTGDTPKTFEQWAIEHSHLFKV